MSLENQIQKNSAYCINHIKKQLWEELENITLINAAKVDWKYLYLQRANYEWINYEFFCSVTDENNVDIQLKEINEEKKGNDIDKDLVVEEPEININQEENSIILVFSPTWNTKRMAKYISELTNIKLIEILAAEPYTEEDLNWRNEESRTFTEFKNPNIRPEIETEINIDNYDTVYLWFPIWFWITPNLILTLLEKYDFSGKNIILFCTSEHVGIERAVEYLDPYNLNVKTSHRFAQDTTKEQVQEWLESL